VIECAISIGIALEENSKTFRKCRLIPRVMRDVGTTSTKTKIFGLPSALPIYVSPASNALLGHPDAEFNIVRGAARTGIVQGVSAASSLPLNELLDEKHNMDEEIEEGKWGRGLGDKMGMVYQVYVQEEREKTAKLVREAVDGGVGQVIVPKQV
jgi:L-lactate dehydrogenase (cytochrome)